jgi:flagellar basal-body rod modification protein FlgD
MAVSPVSSSQGNSAAYGLDFQSLLKIILTQLTYQDPLKPVDNFEFISQLAQFSQLQQSQSLNDKIDNLLSAQAATQATTLLGRSVDIQTGQTELTGVVKSVTFTETGPEVSILTADNLTVSKLPISNIIRIR